MLLHCLAAEAITEISIKAEHIEHPQGDARNVLLKLSLGKPSPTLSLKSALKQKPDKDWAQISLNCDVPHDIKAGHWNCAQGLLKSARIDLPFSIEINHLFSNGMPDVNAELRLHNAGMSDEAGLHATEKFTGKLNVAAKQVAHTWLWQMALDWQAGEVFWQPFYFANGGHQFAADGKLEDDLLSFDHAKLKLNNVGELNFNGQMHLADYKLLSFNGDFTGLDLSTAYPLLLQPFLEKTALNNAELAGKAALKVEVKNSELKSFELRLSNVNIADKNRKFAFYNVNANLPWSYDEPTSVSFGYESGELLNLPLGKTNIQAAVNRYALESPNIRLPVLDGALNLSDISAARIGGQWHWHLRARLEPISMEDFSASLKLPHMEGVASAEIPLVTYSGGMLTTDGSVLLNVFQGTATVTQLIMQEPLGKTPKLNADVALRNLDLGDLTRTFSFGAIEGKIDGDIKGLQMQNWKPVQFDAVVHSSAGKYPKKISQRAVENISALGGAGAAAAIQRSFLRFFKQFNYEKMGLSCKLRNDICQMAGVESTPQGYVIVKGSGIPAITVLGYNKTVGWDDLLGRIKRVTDSNSRAIIK